ncbi:hypothetical protein F2Q69_00018207 [Brassica cretica]|uniref:Uncharacterized protein n=1 Tax=Brassica cretica TaxID=69181 RepID=A0A8S9QMU2_BRACR|nr:hypothetical protein F2Q69_00018207 [Brassica cretica]
MCTDFLASLGHKLRAQCHFDPFFMYKHGLVLSWVTRHGETYLDLIHEEGIKMASWMALEKIRRDALGSVRLWIRARFIRTWLKLPHIPHTSLSSNPSHEEDSSIWFSFSMKTEAWRVILVRQTFLIPALMKSHVGSKGGWRGVMNLKPKLLVHELLASGYKKSRCHEDGDLMYEERRGV